MFIALDANPTRGVRRAELNLAGTHLVPFRPPNADGIFVLLIYKHLTPTELTFEEERA